MQADLKPTKELAMRLKRTELPTTPRWIFVLAVAFALVAAADSSVWADQDAPAKTANEDTASKATPEEPEEDYYELFHLLADTLDQIERNYVKDVDRRDLVEAAIRGMLSELDPYSNYIPPKRLEQFRAGVENEFGGVGIQVTIEEGQLKVISPLVGTPAYRAGIIAGDTILEIDGKSVKRISMDDAIRQMKGAPGKEVVLKVKHEDADKPVDVKLEREVIHVDTVLGDRRNEDDSWHWMMDDEKKIGYLRVTAFGRHTAEELREALDALSEQGVKALVLDLRFNPGGLLSAAIEVCDMFIDSGRIVSTEGRNTEPRSWDAHARGTFKDFPMAVLVNHFSASASEIVSACLQDHERAVIVGERTWGKGSVQNIVELEAGGSALKLTTAGYHRPSGKNIHRFPDATDDDEWGVLPSDGFEEKLDAEETRKLTDQRRERDIVDHSHAPVESTIEDRQLDKALAYLVGRLDVSGDGAEESPPEEQEPAEPVVAAKDMAP